MTLDHALTQLAAGFRSLKGIGTPGDTTEDILFNEWDWEVGVGLYGQFREAQRRGDEKAIAALTRWYDWQITRGLPARQVNSTTPTLALALLAEHTGREDWRALCLDWATWLTTKLPRCREGGFEHVVKEGRRPGQLWDDTLFMAVLFLAATGRAFDRPDWVAEAHYQCLTHIRHLSDPQTGLFFHGWCDHGRHNYARALWARGNAWVTIALPELFVIAPPTDPALHRHLATVLQTQVGAIAPLQAANGMFHTLLNDPTSPQEASATAGFGYGILSGIRQGLLPEHTRAIAQLAQTAILARIDKNGLLQEVSDGTAMGDTLEFYHKIPNTPTPYGQALATLFLLEFRAQT